MTVFNADYANRYDSLYASKDYAAECDLIEAAFAANGASPSTILDIGCGTGSHAIELAKRGYHCSGVDQSRAMLDIAQSKAASTELRSQPDWYCGNAVDFETGRQYDAAIMMFAVVSYLTTNEMISASLANIANQVKPGGLFICDFWYGPAVLSVRPEDRIRIIENGNSRVLRAAKTTVDSFHQTADVSFHLWTINHHLQPCSVTYKIAFNTRKLDRLTLPRWVGRQCSIRRYCASVISIHAVSHKLHD